MPTPTSDTLPARTMPDPVALARLRRTLVALAAGASIESSTRNAAEVDDYGGLIPAGCDVFLPSLPGKPTHNLIPIAVRLRRLGFNLARRA